MADTALPRRALARLYIPVCGLALAAICLRAAAATLTPAAQQALGSATFEVVQGKPVEDPLTYEKPLPLELIPFRERNDKFRSIGTAFAIGPNRFVSAAHVFDAQRGSQYGPLALRDVAGKTYRVDQILKYSNAEDFVVFSVQGAPAVTPLDTNPHPTLNQSVFAVGNALGDGVVIRDGLYTSDSPEEVDGRWSWLRFSAAASPGNSGGPLVDRNGKVIGIVLRKSPSENLNFALPIALALDAAADSGVIESRSTYRLGVMKTTETWKWEDRLPLPRPVGDFYADMLALFSQEQKKLHAGFFERHGADIFPNGDHAAELLHSTYGASFPRLIGQSDSGVWDATDHTPKSVQLEHNGFVQVATAAATLGIARLKVPDDVAPQDLVTDSKRFMDLLLKALPLERAVGTDSVRVTSLGAAHEEAWIADSYGRRWQVRSWVIPFSDASMLTIALPTPDSFTFILAQVPTGTLDVVRRELELYTRFIYVSYDGTLKQWRDYLAHPETHPSILASLTLQFDYGRGFAFRSPRFQLAVPAGLQQVGADSVLRLRFTFFTDAAGPTWDVGGIYLADDKEERHWVNVWRHARPDAALPERFATQWRNITTGAPPYDSLAHNVNGRTAIDALVNDKDVIAGKSNVAYTATVSVEGVQTPSHMRNAFDTLRRGVTVFEH